MPANPTLALPAATALRTAPPLSLRENLLATSRLQLRRLFPDAQRLEVSLSDSALTGVPATVREVYVQAKVTDARGAPAELEGFITVTAQGEPTSGQFRRVEAKKGDLALRFKGDEFTVRAERSARPSFAQELSRVIERAAEARAESNFVFHLAAQPANYVDAAELDELLGWVTEGGVLTSRGRGALLEFRAASVASSLPETLTSAQAATVNPERGARLTLSRRAAEHLSQTLATGQLHGSADTWLTKPAPRATQSRRAPVSHPAPR